MGQFARRLPVSGNVFSRRFSWKPAVLRAKHLICFGLIGLLMACSPEPVIGVAPSLTPPPPPIPSHLPVTGAPTPQEAIAEIITPAFLTPTPTLNPSPTLTPSNTASPNTASLYVFPIQPVEVASYLCGHHDYPATDIQAPVGSHFVAVTSGIVDYVSAVDLWIGTEDDPVTRGGLSIAIVGDDNVRYYGSHLSAIAPGIMTGVRVSAGELLGYTGQSGNAQHVAPHLHFGISHPTQPDDWAVRRGEIDPCPYLQAWEAGEVLAPEIGK